MSSRFALLVLTLSGLTAAVGAQPASASISPSIALNQSAGTTAGSTANLGVDLKFAPSTSDSPDDLTMELPPGLLADASIDGGACLTRADLSDAACQVGTGIVTATVEGVPIPVSVTFDLVPPPAAGDLAGLAVNDNGTQIGSTAAIRIRPSGDPDGVGVSIILLLPDSLDGVPMSISEIDSTFDGLRYPTTCPATPQNVSITVNSYADQTSQSASAPLTVTGCAGLHYAPAFSASATRDAGDPQVQMTTDVTQSADQAPSRSISLAFPVKVVQANLVSLKALCTAVLSSCAPVGSATAVSPLYPHPLTGQAYLTGSFLSLSLTLTFPSPFPLTLVGTVALNQNGTIFTGLPDIPLTDLKVTIDGGPTGLFKTDCRVTEGSATATLTDENGDKTVTAPTSFALSGCPATRPASSPSISGARLSGLRSGHPSLRFTVQAAAHGRRLTKLTVKLPRGLRFVAHRRHERLAVEHLSLHGARLRSATLSHARLVIVVRHPVGRLTVNLGAGALRASHALITSARHHRLHRMSLTVVVATGAGHAATVAQRLRT